MGRIINWFRRRFPFNRRQIERRTRAEPFEERTGPRERRQKNQESGLPLDQTRGRLLFFRKGEYGGGSYNSRSSLYPKKGRRRTNVKEDRRAEDRRKK